MKNQTVNPSKFDILNFDDDDLVQRSSLISSQNNRYDQREPEYNYQQKRRELSDQIDSKESMVQVSLKQQIKDLKIAIAELYLGIKQKTRDENEIISPDEEREEREIILSLDSYVIIEYIKSSVDIILNLKFEEIEKRLLDKSGNLNLENNNSSTLIAKRSIQRNANKDLKGESERSQELQSSDRSIVTQREGPPQIYEEVIQNLEADIRKHIRIEQQLKLHIESIENRTEELENQVDKLEEEKEKVKVNSQKLKENEDKVKQVELLLKDKEDLLQKQENQAKTLRENEALLKKEIEKLQTKIREQTSKSIDPLSFLNQAIDNVSRTNDIQNIMNKTQPMIIKQGMVSVKEKSNYQQKPNTHQDLGSYSSNQSFVDNGSPERRATPDLIHPYQQNQMLSKKKSITKSTQKKKFVPQTIADNFGVQASLNAINSTYANHSTGKIGSRKTSSQSRQSKNSKGAIINFILEKGLNNIQGLSINYSNQIIQNSENSINQLANNFIGNQNLINRNNEEQEDSESSNLNSHRRCKSQNVKTNPNDARANSSIGKKSIDKKNQRQHIVQDISADDLSQFNDSLQKGQLTDQKYNSKNKKTANEDIMFENILYQQFPSKDNSSIIYDFTDSSQNKRRVIKQSQISASTGSANSYAATQAQQRNASNRFQQQSEDLQKLRYNQMMPTQQHSISGIAAPQSRNANINSMHQTSQSMEKNSRSRNKQQFLNQNQTAIIPQKFDSNMFDMHFKTTTSTSTQQQSNGIKGGFMSSKTNSTTNNTSFMNQASVAMMKQQLMANKKATNLLMKGLSPLKKQS